MKNTSTLLLGILIIAALLGFMMTYQVAFNQVGVVTTFGSVQTVRHGDSDEGGIVGNLYFKWPYPIQRVWIYDARNQVLEDPLEQTLTADDKSVLVSTYAVWRIEDPEDFYTQLGTVQRAKEELLSRMRDAHSEVKKYTFDELTNEDPARLRITDLESGIAAKVQDSIERQQYGIRIVEVGIRRFILTQEVSKNVFDRMISTRQRMAQNAISSGDQEARQIRAAANSAKDRILAFVNNRAQDIRAEGDAAAVQYYSAFKKDENFAIFLTQLDALQNMLQHNSTFLLNNQTIPIGLLSQPGEGEKSGSVSKAGDLGKGITPMGSTAGGGGSQP